MEAHKAQGFVALAILLMVAPVVLGQDNLAVEFTAVSTKVVSRLSPENGTCDASGNHTCYNCTVAPYCISIANGYINAGPVTCAELDPSKPYCTDGKCSNDTTIDECKAPGGFICTSDGYFPDPDDCQKFHFCVGNASYDYSCSDNYVYSHENSACIRKKVSSDCAVIKCTYKTLVEYVLYPKNPSVYGICIRGNPTVVFKCEEDEQFDTKTTTCNFVCKKAGLFPDPKDKQKYRECIAISSTKFELVLRQCPPTTTFDADKAKCVV